MGNTRKKKPLPDGYENRRPESDGTDLASCLGQSDRLLEPDLSAIGWIHLPKALPHSGVAVVSEKKLQDPRKLKN
jgi:hypothetical protein